MSQDIQALSEPRLSRFLPYLALDWLGVVAGFSLFALYPTIAGFLAASVILGLAQHGLIVLGHEAVHFRISKSRFLNEWIGRLFCFFPVMITVSSYRDFHFPHHRDPFGKNDPELPLRRALGDNFLVPPFTIARGLRLWALSFLGLSLKELYVFVSMLPRGTLLEKGYLTAFWAAVMFAAYRFGTLPYVALWIFGSVTTYFSMLRIQGWYEHGLYDMATNRYSLPNPLYRLIVPHNIWVHYEHHKYPLVPFYNLERARLLDRSDKIYAFGEMVTTLTNQGRLRGLEPAPERKAA